MLQSTNSGSDVHAFYMRAANVQPDGKLSLSNSKMMWFGSSELSQLDLRAGDVVVVEGGVGGYARAAYLKTDVPNWGFQNSINRVRPLHGNDGRFLAYCLIAARRMDFFSAYCNIVSMPHLTAEKLAAMYIPLPPPAEQRRIADYLDAATSKIDTLITRSERLIELLKERRSAVITTAVTGQIDVTSSKEAA